MTIYFFDECTADITLPQGWKDITYKNDACPSWSFNGFQVFIDHPDPNERECGPESSRFCVMLEQEYGEKQTWFHACDTWAEVLNIVTVNEEKENA